MLDWKVVLVQIIKVEGQTQWQRSRQKTQATYSCSEVDTNIKAVLEPLEQLAKGQPLTISGEKPYTRLKFVLKQSVG